MNNSIKFTLFLAIFAFASAFTSSNFVRASDTVSVEKADVPPCVTGLTITPHPTLAGTYIITWDAGAGGPWTVIIYDMTAPGFLQPGAGTNVPTFQQGGFIAGHTYRIVVNGVDCTGATLVFTAP